MPPKRRAAVAPLSNDTDMNPPPAATPSSPGDETDERMKDEPDYESMRQAQIQRNQQLLSELTGIAASTSLSAADAAQRNAASKAAAAARRAQASLKRKKREEMVALMPRRDLPSRRAKDGRDLNEDRLLTQSAAASSSNAATVAANIDADGDDHDMTPRVNADLKDFVVPDNYPIGRSFSDKSSKEGVPTLALSDLRPYLGMWIPLTYHTPKAAAMSFLTAGWPSPTNKASQRAPPVFNRMSGIQKLANHVAIFINIDPELKGYGNQWFDGGRRITWYAQPTQKVDTPIIGQIITAARAKQSELDGSAKREEEDYAAAILGDTNDDEGPKRKKAKRVPAPQLKSDAAVSASSSSSSVDPRDAYDPFSVLLFLRFAGGAYIYAGPLAYHSHNTTRTPMQFVFTLTEYDTLIKTDPFRELLPNGGKNLSAATPAKK